MKRTNTDTTDNTTNDTTHENQCKRFKAHRNMSVVRPFATLSTYQRIMPKTKAKPNNSEYINIGEMKKITAEKNTCSTNKTKDSSTVYSELILYLLKSNSKYSQVSTKYNEAVINEYIEALINGGADPNFCDKDGNSALSLLIRSNISNSLQIMQTLIDAGADPNTLDSNGWPMVMRAVIFNCPKELQILIDAGADLHVTKYGKDLCDLSKEYTNKEVITTLINAYQKLC